MATDRAAVDAIVGGCRRPPYPGARPAAVVPADRLDDAGWLHALLRGTTEELRKPPGRRGSGQP